MSEFAIQADGLGKQYRLGKRQRYKSLRESLAGLFNRQSAIENRKSAELWALRDVSVTIAPGEVVGIIGRNGAGKSTLLKILARITEPTTGAADVAGRVGSLLEVGTGFHPELTGRENIYLNGAILGMTRAEIARQFDEIVAFAEVERFLDTPVKHYSSGMAVRLAFAVAAQLQPEILLVDEVLAVGDAAFQRRCLGRMSDVARSGRTVLFVSHNLAAVARLCSRSLLLDGGRLVADGPSPKVIAQYLAGSSADRSGSVPGEFELTRRQNTYAPHRLLIRRVRLLDGSGRPRAAFLMGDPLQVEIELAGLAENEDTLVGVQFRTWEDQVLASVNTGMVAPTVAQPRGATERAVLTLPRLPFTPGRYAVNLSITRGPLGRQYRIDYAERAAEFTVTEADVYGTGYRVSAEYGVLFLDASWAIARAPEPCTGPQGGDGAAPSGPEGRGPSRPSGPPPIPTQGATR